MWQEESKLMVRGRDLHRKTTKGGRWRYAWLLRFLQMIDTWGVPAKSNFGQAQLTLYRSSAAPTRSTSSSPNLVTVAPCASDASTRLAQLVVTETIFYLLHDQRWYKPEENSYHQSSCPAVLRWSSKTTETNCARDFQSLIPCAFEDLLTLTQGPYGFRKLFSGDSRIPIDIA